MPVGYLQHEPYELTVGWSIMFVIKCNVYSVISIFDLLKNKFKLPGRNESIDKILADFSIRGQMLLVKKPYYEDVFSVPTLIFVFFAQDRFFQWTHNIINKTGLVIFVKNKLIRYSSFH